jgi:RNA 3'-terminal phosphate cyclase (ATP)
MQQALPCLLFAHHPVTLILKGGTNTEMAPQVDYILDVLIPTLKQKIGIDIKLDLIRRGFYPRGGGELRLHVTPIEDHLNPICLVERGQLVSLHIRSFVAGSVPLHVMI